MPFRMDKLSTPGFKPFSLNIKGRIIEYTRPVVMGIVNATDDSFFAGSRTGVDSPATSHRAEKMAAEGAGMIDIGAYSSRPGAADIPADEEIRRLEVAVKAVRRAVGDDMPISVDTFRADVALRAIADMGADIVNDISGGLLDPEMFGTVARLRVPYILMHMRGTPATMQTLTDYPDGVTAGVICELQSKVRRLALMGVADVIVDPGFGFAKTLDQNYELMSQLATVGQALGRPMLVGVSRKSMISKLTGTTPAEALNGTTVLHTAALLQGASILRVHDVGPACEAVRITEKIINPCDA